MTGKKALWIIPLMLLLFSGTSYSWKWFSADEPLPGLKGNSYVDIEYFDGIIWMASEKGLNYSNDFGQTWYTHDTSTGLSSNEPSAIFARSGQIWVAGSHSQIYQGVSYPFGNGIDLSLDSGATWENLAPPEASSFAKLVYDIAGDSRSTYAACFHGGFIVTHDTGKTWSHLFFSQVDSSDWEADNWADLESGRYYSCAVDTFHADTLIVYGGSARGINKFLYIPRRVKMGGNNITAITGNTAYIYLAHENGISQADTSLTTFYTSGTDNGLPADSWTRHLILFGGRLWASLFSKSDSSGLGLYYLSSPDEPWTVFDSSLTGPSDFWTKLDTSLFEGEDAGVYDFKALNDSVLFVAAGDSGVFRSLDSGMTWQRFYVDSTDTDYISLRNQVLSVDATTDSLYLGTKGGLVKASYSDPFTIDYDTLIHFAEDDSTGSVVSIVRHHEGDTVFTWIALQPHPDSSGGNYAALEITDTASFTTWVIYSLQPTPTIINQIVVNDTFTTFATTSGLLGNFNINRPTLSNFSFTPNDDTTGLTLVNYRFNAAARINGRLFGGSSGGFGYRRSAANWHVVRTNTNPLIHDLVVSHKNSNSGLPGDWVVALEVQKKTTDTLLWAACRRVPDTVVQYNTVAYSRDFGASWTKVLDGEAVWNFAFDTSGTVYAAASSGLYYTSGSPDTWQKANIIDPITLDTIWAETEVYSVEVVDTILWVGTSLGLAYRPIDNADDWHIVRVFKETESVDDLYAAPVPFSPLSPNGRLTLHYRVEESADVTVEVYDFAMNLVRRLAENKHRDGGDDYFETWDGRNGDGDVVATGMYFFKVTYSTGQEKWGRLAIIP